MLHVFAIRDLKAEAYANPFFLPAFGLALRSFEDEAKREGSMIAAHPGDFQLFHFGQFNEQTGEYVLDTPKLLASASDFTNSPAA